MLRNAVAPSVHRQAPAHVRSGLRIALAALAAAAVDASASMAQVFDPAGEIRSDPGTFAGSGPYAAPPAMAPPADTPPAPPPSPPPPIPAVVLPGLPRTCTVTSATTARHVAVDAGRTYYAAVTCSGIGRVLASNDGGRTWRLPVTVATEAVRQIAVEGGTVPGSVLVGWEDFFDRFFVRASHDGGVTWTAPVQVASGAIGLQGLSLAAHGSSFYAAVHTEPGAAFIRSQDRGLTWSSPISVAQPWIYGDVVVEPVTGNPWLVSDTPAFHLRRSRDGGMSFEPEVTPPGSTRFSDWSLGGGGMLYAIGLDGMWAIDLATLASRAVAGLAPYTALQGSVHADTLGNALVATASGPVTLARLPAGATALGAPTSLAAAGNNPSVVSCGADAALVVYGDTAGRVLFQKVCYGANPLACCERSTSPPVCDAGGPYEGLGCIGEAVEVPLAATASDPEGGPLTYAWSTSCSGASFADPGRPDTVFHLDGAAMDSCPEECQVTLTVTDAGGAQGSCATSVTLSDTVAPVFADLGPVDGTCLWPPNHRWVCYDDLVSAVTAIDNCAGAPAVVVAAVHSDQPEDSGGDGDTAPDVRLVGPEGAATGVCVRAERLAGVAGGRTYSVDLVATDGCGKTSSATLSIHVPHDGNRRDGCRLTGRAPARRGAAAGE